VSEKLISYLGSHEAKHASPGHICVAHFVHNGVIPQRLLLGDVFELMDDGYGSIVFEVLTGV
jgi:hypothetical protein